MSEKPLVSIGMPVYNGDFSIKRALEALLSQDYGDFELIVSDNASTDQTAEICQKYAQKDKRIRYYRHDKTIASTDNFNYVFELSRGQYFMFASHNQRWSHNYVSQCLDAFNISESVILAGTLCGSIAPDGKSVAFIDPGLSTVGTLPFDRYRYIKKTFHNGTHVGGTFYGLYKRAYLKKVMPMKRVVGTDHLALIELSFMGEFVTVPKELTQKKQGGMSYNLKTIIHHDQITNPFLIYCPYLAREGMLQKIIFKTSALIFREKVMLGFWSFMNYLVSISYLALREIYWKLRPVENIIRRKRTQL